MLCKYYQITLMVLLMACSQQTPSTSNSNQNSIISDMISHIDLLDDLSTPQMRSNDPTDRHLDQTLYRRDMFATSTDSGIPQIDEFTDMSDALVNEGDASLSDMYITSDMSVDMYEFVTAPSLIVGNTGMNQNFIEVEIGTVRLIRISLTSSNIRVLSEPYIDQQPSDIANLLWKDEDGYILEVRPRSNEGSATVTIVIETNVGFLTTSFNLRVFSTTNCVYEVCDQVDNDCDGLVDESFDHLTNPNHCGTCNTVCAFPNAISVCNNSACEIDRCDLGFGDANRISADGCECVFTNDGQESNCDGLDNDCDGAIDEEWDSSTPCTIHFITNPDTCNPSLGQLDIQLDQFGALASYMSGYRNHYDAFGDSIAPIPTIADWKVFLCRAYNNENLEPNGAWLTGDDQALRTSMSSFRYEDNETFINFTIWDILITVSIRFDCNKIKYCYQMSNLSMNESFSISLFPYLDAKFGSGDDTTDYGVLEDGESIRLSIFDERLSENNIFAPSIYTSMMSVPNDNTMFLGNYQIDSQSLLKSRIENVVDTSCLDAANMVGNSNISRNGMNADEDGNYTTDSGFNVAVSQSYETSILLPNERSEEICFALEWGFTKPCYDLDQDNICYDNDNCPYIWNADQLDTDIDNQGDVCDND